MRERGQRRHTTRWLAAAVLLVLVGVGVVLATRTPQEATQIDSPLLGHLAPQFSGTDLRTGARVSLASFRGHYVFVNFFASWCVPCQQEAPDLITFAYDQQHVSGGADLLSVVFHDETSAARQFLVAQGESWPAVSDPGGMVAEHYGVSDPPTTFLVDPTGRITVNPVIGPATQPDLDALLHQAQRATAGRVRASGA
ncbi:MAG TPA: TlpA disulfide reductase family protein [Acidimicrobiales bacterium]|nr:TlpA disulfide reductase family protein [Acidimicrobiales bacterium]